MDRELMLVMIGAVAAIFGGIIGGVVQGWAWYYFEQKRATTEKRSRWVEKTLGWAADGRKESLRRADLFGADLRHVDLCAFPWNDPPHLLEADEARELFPGVDLSYANLRKTDMTWGLLVWADLTGADLSGATLRGTNLLGANLSESNLSGVDLTDANLKEAYLAEVRFDGSTVWPKGFSPPPSKPM